jgi:hypothetical protein
MNPGGTLGLDLKEQKIAKDEPQVRIKEIMHHIFVINPKAGRSRSHPGNRRKTPLNTMARSITRSTSPSPWAMPKHYVR